MILNQFEAILGVQNTDIYVPACVLWFLKYTTHEYTVKFQRIVAKYNFPFGDIKVTLSYIPHFFVSQTLTLLIWKYSNLIQTNIANLKTVNYTTLRIHSVRIVATTFHLLFSQFSSKLFPKRIFYLPLPRNEFQRFFLDSGNWNSRK